MDDVVARAIENVRRERDRTDWSTLAPGDRIALIYKEVRRLDRERLRRRLDGGASLEPRDPWRGPVQRPIPTGDSPWDAASEDRAAAE